LSEPIHEPATTRPTAEPTYARDQLYDLLGVRPTPSLQAHLPSIAHRALRVLTVMLVLVAICLLATHQLNDRGEREDAEQKKRLAGGSA